MSRKYNFSAGPSTLPEPVLEELQKEIVDYKGSGQSLIEASHRGKDYDHVHNETISLFKKIMNIPDNYKVVFVGGGATLQFSMIPMNYLAKSCDFTLTGTWSKKACADAKKIGSVNVLFDGSENKYTDLPDPSTIKPSSGSSYVHITSNETIQGVQWKDWPETGGVPLIADMSSDIMSRAIPVEKFDLIYAGAQKNLGPAGLAVVIIKDDMIEKSNENLTAYLNYKIHADNNSLYNTPPVFPIYAFNKVLHWVEKQGGMKAIEQLTKQKADILYNAIDSSNGYYKCPVQKEFRSQMNVVFTLPNADLDAQFIAEAAESGMVALKGHRSIGGCRASIYNAMPVEGCQRLADFMKDFSQRNG